MKVVVTSSGSDINAEVNPAFGRCPVYVFVDPETMEYEAVENPAANAFGGAGIQAAQFVVEHGAEAVITGNVGPNAYDVFRAANVPVFRGAGGTVRQAVEAYAAGKLESAAGADVGAHAGMGAGAGGQRVPSSARPGTSASEEVKELQQEAADLRKRLAQIIERLDHLERRAKP